MKRLFRSSPLKQPRLIEAAATYNDWPRQRTGENFLRAAAGALAPNEAERCRPREKTSASSAVATIAVATGFA